MWQTIVDSMVYSWLGLTRGDRYAEALNFFVYDGIKILVMLCVIIFAVTLVRSWFDTEKVRKFLIGKHPLVGHVAASLFGIVTPFCSCSAVPLFLGFMQARIPVGVAFSFLISAPMNNEIAIGMLFAMFGWKIAALYVSFGLMVAIIGGLVLGKLGVEKWVSAPLWNTQKPSCGGRDFDGIQSRVSFSIEYTKDIVRKIWVWVLVGVGVGAFVHGFVPADFVASIAGKDNVFAVPLAVLAGVPVYANCAGAMPLIIPMIDKGMAMGTALAFMMSVTALSLPEAIILKRILNIRLIILFFSIVAIGIMCVGFIFNMVL